MKNLFSLLIAFIPLSAYCEILNWDPRIGLSASQVEYVTEAATKLESEWMDEENICTMTAIRNFELISVEFYNSQVLRFQIQSEVELGGERCPGQVLGCQSVFSWLGPKDWDVKTQCEDPS